MVFLVMSMSVHDTANAQIGMPFKLINPPLVQFKSGTSLADIICYQQYVLVIKTENSHPACVTAQTAQKLVERNWGTIATNQNKTILENQDDSNNKFAFLFFSQILKQDKGNVFFSPYSMSSAFSMVYEGARGETADQIQSIFHFIPDDTIRKNYVKSVNSELNSNKQYKLDVTNAVWIQNDYHIVPGYVDTLQKYYDANATNLDLKNKSEDSRKIINTWVANKTNQKINNLFPPNSINQDSRLVLTNAIYFKANWTNPFIPFDTQDENFTTSTNHAVTVPMMSTFAKFPYYEDNSLQVLQMPYQGDRLSMIVLLPKDKNIQSLDGVLSPNQLHKWNANLVQTQVKVYMPKFTLDTKYVLNDNLKSLGITDAFDPNLADFTGITGNRNLSISLAVHQAFVKVDEKGTEAVAATGVVAEETSMPLYNYTFRADHPFVFLIYDKQTDLILFIGQMMDPSAK